MLVNLASYYTPKATGGVFDPATLFASGEQGAWYEPKPEYLYQDAAGTTPVTADGQPVGRMLDLSGNGNHVTQSTASLKPLYRTDGTLRWLEFDGVDDRLLAAVAFVTGSSQRTFSVATKINIGSGNNYIFGYGSAATSQTFALEVGETRGRIVAFGNDWEFGNPYNTTDVFVTSGWYDGTDMRVQIDSNTIYGPSARAYNTGSNAPFTLGVWPHTTVDPLDGLLYAYVLCEGALIDENRQQLDQYIGETGGKTL